jgi:hypothetical protein
MTFTVIRTAVMDRLNLTSSAAQTRIGNSINDRHRRITTSLGIILSRRGEVTAATVDDNQYVTFTGIERIDTIIDDNGAILDEVSVGEIDDLGAVETGEPSQYAVYSMDADGVTIKMDVLGPAANETLTATGVLFQATLSGTDEPALPESFHDIVVHGTVADEARKLQKLDIAKDAEEMYEKRIAELRLFLASSIYKDIYPAKRARVPRWRRGVI